jgi:mycothiol system anti-sigma-R factor
MNADAQARCAETVKLLGEFLDRELTACEITTVQGHLDRCPPCLNVYRFEEKLKRLVRVHCERDCAPVSLRDEILARLKRPAPRP